MDESSPVVGRTVFRQSHQSASINQSINQSMELIPGCEFSVISRARGLSAVCLFVWLVGWYVNAPTRSGSAREGKRVRRPSLREMCALFLEGKRHDVAKLFLTPRPKDAADIEFRSVGGRRSSFTQTTASTGRRAQENNKAVPSSHAARRAFRGLETPLSPFCFLPIMS